MARIKVALIFDQPHSSDISDFYDMRVDGKRTNVTLEFFHCEGCRLRVHVGLRPIGPCKYFYSDIRLNHNKNGKAN